MPEFLADPTPTHFLVLFVFGVVAVGVWWRNRDRRSLAIVGVAVLLLAGLFACDTWVESPREEAVRRVGEIETAINAHRWDEALSHFADSFSYRGKSKKHLADPVIRDRVNREVVRVATWDFAREQVERPDDRHIVIGFMARGDHTYGQFAGYFRVTFEKQTDSTWKVATFDVYSDPLRRDTDPPIAVPGL